MIDPEALIDEEAVNAYLIREFVKREALRRIAAHEAADIVIPALTSLAELFQEEITDTNYRIDQWQPVNSRVILSAQNKAGKTTMRDNLVRSLVDGDPWLDVAGVDPVSHVTIIDNEMSERQAKLWLKDQGIQNTASINFMALRGHVSRFNILDDHMRSRWADELRGTSYLIFDCLRPALDAFGLDEQRDTGKFLLPFDGLLAEAGINEALIIHHMGHTSGRARGDSRLRDWPDVEWFLERKSADDPASPRYVKAYGRDVDVPKGKLHYTPANRHLSYQSTLPIKESQEEAALVAVERYLTTHGPTAQKGIEKAKPEGLTREAIRSALTLGSARQRLTFEVGDKNAKIWRRAAKGSASTN